MKKRTFRFGKKNFSFSKVETFRFADYNYADCVIRWRDTLETEEARIALAMDSDTEKDDEIFFYCDSLDDLKSLADKGGEDFTVAGCLGFGIYEELLQTT